MSFISLGNKVKFKNDKDAPKFGKVINRSDPKGLGRIKVQLPGLYDPTDEQGSNLPWIRRMRTTMGVGVEEVNIPVVGDIVELYWPYDNQHAFYRGIPSGDASKLGSFEVENGYDWGWGFSSGLKICVNKVAGTFLLKTPNYYIHNLFNGELNVVTQDKINVTAEGDITVNGNSDVTVNVKGDTTVSVKGDTDITTDGDTTITSKGSTSIKTLMNTDIETLVNTNLKSLGPLTITGVSTTSIEGATINITGGAVNIGRNTIIDGKSFLGHTHSGVMSGGGSTGPVE